jgi:poly-gamma-glutamate capsule biosynthesis protein CapA/YwtB (metallophosphatase superfamily)
VSTFKLKKTVWLIFWCLCLIAPTLAADQPTAPPPLTVAAVGDIMLGSDYPSAELPPEDGRALFDEVRDLFQLADVSFGNLEGVLSDGGLCAKNTDSAYVYAFRTPTRFARTLKDARLKVLSLANNHCRDFGYTGKLATKQALKDEGLQFSSQDGEVAEFNVRGSKVGLMAVSFGPRPRSISYPEELLGEIESLARKYDVFIISVHGGREGRGAQRVRDETEYFLEENRGNLVRFARSAVDRGADLILGHGPHVPRALELYKGRLIAYSLGNFCTYKGMNLDEARGYAPLLWTELGPAGEFRRGRIHSFIQYRPGGPKKDQRQRAAEFMRILSLQDFPATSPLITAQGEILPLPRAAEAPGTE